jgi:hypothetical protein
MKENNNPKKITALLDKVSKFVHSAIAESCIYNSKQKAAGRAVCAVGN